MESLLCAILETLERVHLTSWQGILMVAEGSLRRRFSPRMQALLACMILLLLWSASCAKKRTRTVSPVSTRPPLASVIGAWEEGVASWYGHPYHGRRTANGEVYDQEMMTAAHPTLRFGAVVEVTNLTNGLRTRVRINDRGPFVANRAIDLSRAAAREIAMLGPGTAPVRVEVVGLPEVPAAPTTGAPQPVASPAHGGTNASSASANSGSSASNGSTAGEEGFAIQMGAFLRYENAVALRDELAQRALDVRIVAVPSKENENQPLWRVIVGRNLRRDDATRLFEALRVDFPRIFLVSDH
jgi:rare lipoprotein A